MSLDGIWTSEIYGPFGWENQGIFVLEKGRILGGDNRQYSFGSYTESGGKMRAELQVHYYGPPRTVFGETREEFVTVIEGVLKDDIFNGAISRADKPNFDLQFRLTKRIDLPEG